MTKPLLITRHHAKRTTAAAIGDAKQRNGWSNADTGDALGVGEGTIRNRLDGDDPSHQMTVHELLRSIQSDGTHMANAILGIVEHHVLPTGCSSAPDALAVAGQQARCAAELIGAAADGIDRDEARVLLPMVTDLKASLALLEASLRQTLGRGPPTK